MCHPVATAYNLTTKVTCQNAKGAERVPRGPYDDALTRLTEVVALPPEQRWGRSLVK